MFHREMPGKADPPVRGWLLRFLRLSTCRPGSEGESDRAEGRSGEEGAALPTQGKDMAIGRKARRLPPRWL